MGLSEEDETRPPYFEEKRLKEEEQRWKELTTSKQYVEIAQNFQYAIEDHLHQRIVARLKAKEIKTPTVAEVIRDGFFFTEKICEDIVRAKPILIEKMLERFELLKR